MQGVLWSLAWQPELYANALLWRLQQDVFKFTGPLKWDEEATDYHLTAYQNIPHPIPSGSGKNQNPSATQFLPHLVFKMKTTTTTIFACHRKHRWNFVPVCDRAKSDLTTERRSFKCKEVFFYVEWYCRWDFEFHFQRK